MVGPSKSRPICSLHRHWLSSRCDPPSVMLIWKAKAYCAAYTMQARIVHVRNDVHYVAFSISWGS